MVSNNEERWTAHWRCFLACGLVVLSPFQYGIDFGMIGGLQAMVGFLRIYGHQVPTSVAKIGWNLDTTRQQLISSLMTLGAFISSGGAGFIAIKLGRKTSLWIACLLCMVSNIIMMATEDIGALYAGRLLIGIANGMLMTFSQLYIQESATAKHRGLFLALFQLSTSVGTLIGTLVDWATSTRPDKSAYLIPLGLIYVIPVILVISLFFIPESPRWLILQGRYEDGLKALTWLRPAGSNISEEANEIRAAIEKEFELGSSVGILDMFRNSIDRRRTILAVCAVTLQAASGSMYIIAYKAYFLTMSRVENPFAMSNVLSVMGILAIIFNSLIVVRWGRRREILMTGLSVCGVLQLISAIAFDKNPGADSTGKVLVALTCLYMMSYNGMVATYAWLAGGEIPSQRLRSYTFGLAAAIGFLGAWITTFTAPYFINPESLNWGPRYGYIWFPSCVVAALFVFFFLPETKGRTLEEIDEMFEAKVPARKFASFQCVGIATLERKTTTEEEVLEGTEKTPTTAKHAEIAG